MEKKAALWFAAAALAVVLISLPLMKIEQKREMYKKWGIYAELAETDERAKYIIDHEDIYPPSLRDIIHWDKDKDEAYSEETLDFIYEYAFHKDDHKNMSYTEAELNCKTVPHLYMTDTRWCYQDIDGSYINNSGCAATSLAMAYIYLTGKGDADPYSIMKIADSMNALGMTGGIIDVRLPDVAEAIGLKAEVHSYSENMQKTGTADIAEVKSIIDSGNVVIAGFSGDTFGIHAVIISECDGENIKINDPNGPEKENILWKFSDLEPELMFIYDVSAAN